MIAVAIHCNAANYLRVNQIGYLVDDVKVAVIMMEHGDAPTSFCVVNADSGKKTVMHSVKPTGEFAGSDGTARLLKSKDSWHILHYCGRSEILIFPNRQRCLCRRTGGAAELYAAATLRMESAYARLLPPIRRTPAAVRRPRR